MASNTPPVSSNQQSTTSLKDSAKYIIGAILLALIGYFGWSYYQSKANTVDTAAADSYMDIQERMLEIETAEQNPNLDEAAKLELIADRNELNTRIDALINDHNDSIYAWQALMLKARHLVDEDKYNEAAEVFEQAMTIDLNDAGLSAIAHLRYAAALLGAEDVSGALLAASVEVPMAFEATKQELLGDIYREQDDEEKAQRAYQNAWDILKERQEERAILKLKMEDLGLTPEPIEVKPSIIAMPTIDEEEARIALQEEAKAMSSHVDDKNVEDAPQSISQQPVTPTQGVQDSDVQDNDARNIDTQSLETQDADTQTEETPDDVSK